MKKTFVLCVLALALSACSDDVEENQTAKKPPPSQAAAANSTAAPAANPDWPTYKIATEANYPPFQYRDENGVPIGFEVELMQAVARAAQFNAHIVHTSRKEWERTLNNDSFHIWSSSFTISPERKEVAGFSKPFLAVENVVYVVDNEKNQTVRSAADLKGKKIAVSSYSKSAPEIVGKLTGSAGLVVPTDTFYLALKSVYGNKTDGVFGQDLVLAYYSLHNPAVKMKQINVGEPKKEVAFVVKKGNTELLDKLNEGLDKVRADGTYAKLLKRWFGDRADGQR
ncbi:transporter substrate-binding domain-containing protein [Conchiformibius kuhniae]|uniref:Transporter substrate-binding domain-containing protein n=1 Tax=Conchiformibius kuhniae TaxID=211502 RepID=A0A8T9MWX8_9NEIS|nr:transporter substrate-binding domain-containing protein [Conchiformibius kuhniae]